MRGDPGLRGSKKTQERKLIEITLISPKAQPDRPPMGGALPSPAFGPSPKLASLLAQHFTVFT
jgi:hypothetical protein